MTVFSSIFLLFFFFFSSCVVGGRIGGGARTGRAGGSERPNRSGTEDKYALRVLQVSLLLQFSCCLPLRPLSFRQYSGTH